MAMRIIGRERRKLRIRRKISGTPQQPRLTVFRSSKHIYAQVVDDVSGKTLAHASTLSKGVKAGAPSARSAGAADGKPTKTDQAKMVGQAIAGLLKSKGVEHVVFDRNGYLYHGRVRALADGAREAGLKF
jgi:large subunit ribosomal protein L18